MDDGLRMMNKKNQSKVLTPDRVLEINSKRYLLGVTGSYKCGKTYTCRQLVKIGEEKGIRMHHIKLDSIRKEILGVDAKYDDVKEKFLYTDTFGKSHKHIMRSDGSINRPMLKSIILNDEAAHKEYRLILIATEMKMFNSFAYTRNGIILFEWAMLVEEEYLPIVNYNALLLYCKPEDQLERIRKVNRDIEEKILKIEQQMPYEEKKKSILKAQSRTHEGDFYEFETHGKIAKSQYVSLLEQIVANIK
jgi:dephospho-CoA kinase